MEDETFARMQSRINKAMGRLREKPKSRTIDEIETAALELRDEIGRIVAEEMTKESASETDSDSAPEPPLKLACSCGRWARFKGYRERWLVMMLGNVRSLRRYYYCRCCDSGFFPSDEVLECVHTSFTLRTRQEVTRLCSVSSSYDMAVSILEDLAGVRVSSSHAQRITEEAGLIVDGLFSKRRASALSDKLESAFKPDILYLLADGVMTPTLEGYRETKVGVAVAYGDGKQLSKQYTSHLGDSERFSEDWYALARRNGVSNAKQTVILGDGSRWIWNQGDFHFPGATQILDIWHALDRLCALARNAFGEGTRAGADWIAERLAEMKESRIADVMGAIRKLATQFPKVRENAKEELTYVRNNQFRMDYARYIKLGLWIGSGTVESACKQVVTQRLKGAGMRWKEQNAQTISRLRCLILGGEWAQFKNCWNPSS